jgi:hypothetical protein
MRLLAYAYATSDDWRNLMQLLETGGAGVMAEEELEKFRRAASELGRADDARRIRSLGAGSRARRDLPRLGASKSERLRPAGTADRRTDSHVRA